ncbi:MAG: amino acid adenylation domain-containing protein, partial [bacterium]|nr:amino acid adenylation domain-containing protein [bacterium]
MEKLTKKNIEDVVALTPMQEGMLFHYLKDPESDHYLEQFSLELSGDVRKQPFEKAWNFVVRANQMLRTVFRWEKLDRPVQMILKEHPLQPEYHNLSGLEPGEKAKRLREIKAAAKTGVMDLSEVPFGVTLCKMKETGIVMIITNHHILYDGWSNGIILKEFFSAYHAFYGGRPPTLPGKTGFREYLRWIGERDKAEQEAWWEDYLNGFEDSGELGIKTGKGKGVSESRTIETWHRSLGEEGTGQLEAFTAQRNITAASVFYSAWGLLLQGYNNTPDVLLGMTVSGRSAKVEGIEEMVGLFINSLPLRVHITDGSITLEQLASDIHHTLQAMEPYESTPLVDIGKYSPLAGDGDHELFDTLVTVENYPLDRRLVEGERTPVLTPGSFTMEEKTHYQLSVGIMMTEDIRIDILYDTGSFEAGAIQGLGNHFQRLIHEIISHPSRQVRQTDMLTDDEKRRVLEEFNGTDGVSPYSRDRSLHQLFADRVQNTPHKIVCVEKGNHLTFRQLDMEADALADELGLDTSPRLTGVMMEPGIDLLTGILAILKSGHCCVPVSSRLPDRRVCFTLDDCHMPLLLTDGGNEEKARRCSGISRWTERVLRLPLPKRNQPSPARQRRQGSGVPLDRPCYVIYTSGSTGLPKGVLITYRNLSPLLEWSGECFNFGPHTRVLQNLSYFFDFGVFELITTLCFGGTLYFPHPEHLHRPSQHIDFLNAAQVNTFHTTPSFFSHILQSTPGKQLPFLRVLHFGGESLTRALIMESSARLDRQCIIYNGYGPTECTINASIFSIRAGDVAALEQLTDSALIGKPSANNTIYILDRHGLLQPPGVPGEICIGGDGMAPGYLNRPELSSEKFYGGPGGGFSKEPPGRRRHYKTGDKGRWMADGNIEFLGRIDQQVKIRGFRIEPGEIENRLSRHESVKDAVVIARDGPGGEKYLCAYIIPVEGELTDSRARDYLAAYFPDYMVPSYFVKLDSMPLTPNGKVDRKALPEPGITSLSRHIPPRDETERRLASIWSGILGIDAGEIGIDDGFFQLGGHSLKAITQINRVHKVFGIRMPLQVFFDSPVIREVAHFIHGARSDVYHAIEPVETRDYYPLSSAQKRLFILHQMAPGATAYNLPGVLRLKGSLDRHRLEGAFKSLIHRHESLRTSFRVIEGEPVQEIHPPMDFEIPIERGDADIPRLVGEFIQPFDLSVPPLLRVRLIAHGEDRFLLLFDMHHIVSDGASMELFTAEFVSSYSGDHLAPLRLQYKDVSQWQNHSLLSGELKLREQYWLREFEDEPPVLHLPSDHARPREREFAGSRFNTRLGREETNGLKQLVPAGDITLFMILTAIYNILLFKLTGREDIVIGTPIAGRKHADTEAVIGMFVNTLALRNFPANDKTFKSFLNEVKIKTLTALDNQEYPFEELVDKVVRQRDQGRNPLFDVMIAMGYSTIREINIPGLEVNPYPVESGISKFDLTVEFEDEGEELAVSAEYYKKLFRPETIVRFMGFFKKIVSDVLNHGQEIPISEIQLLSPEEKKQILYDFNDTDAEYPQNQTVHQLFEEQVERFPNRTALTGPHSVAVTYHELNRKAGQLAGVLRSKGTGADSIVAIMMERSLEMVVGIFAVLKAGGAYLPISPGMPEERVDFMLGDSNAIFCISDNWEKEKNNNQLSMINDQLLMKSSAPSAVKPANLAYIIYTSGSTGKPKGVMVEHGALVNRLYWLREKYSFTQDDVISQVTAFHFDASVCELFRWIPGGGRLFLPEPGLETEPRQLIEAMHRNRVTIADFAPSLFAILLEHMEDRRPGTLSMLRYVFVGAEVMTPELVYSFHKSLGNRYDTKLINAYGPTEAVVDVTHFDCSTGQYPDIIPIGQPIANVRILILGKDRRLQPIGVAGELCVQGKSLARGYLNQPLMTNNKFQTSALSASSAVNPRMYLTGDLAQWLPDGNIRFLGRIDQQVKIRGFRIEPGEIEQQLLTHPNIKEALVVMKGEPGNPNYPCAYISSADTVWDPEPSMREYKEYLSFKLPGYMIPSYFIRLETIPLTAGGKPDRKALPLPPRTSAVPVGMKDRPRTTIQEQLIDIWSEILGHPPESIGVHDNFFDVGGNSLSIIRVVSRIKDILGREVPFTVMFNHPTIHAMAAHLETNEPDSKPVPSDRLPVSSEPAGKEVAVVGMAGRFPGARNIRQFWDNLLEGRETISFLSETEARAVGAGPALLRDPDFVRAKGRLENSDTFDSSFFGYTHSEAETMDPQLRIFHECVWEALEDAGYDPNAYPGEIGLFAGASQNLYRQMSPVIEMIRGGNTGNLYFQQWQASLYSDKDYLNSLISYKLNLRGPVVTIHTACSTSLVAIDMACESLTAGKCQLALAGGVNVTQQDEAGHQYREGMVASPDGHCRAFDSNANGTVGGNGAGVVVLKPLANALTEGDSIHAVIKGSALNNDGAGRVGFTAPGIEGQAGAIRKALQRAGIEAESISYVETHGTATHMGDPIEIEALKKAFNSTRKGFCAIGSVKTNIGHLDSASGAAGFIKTVMALKHRVIPPSLHYQNPNPAIDFENSPFRVNTRTMEWKSATGSPLRAGVSSFGIGGTNAHVILEEPPLPMGGAGGGNFHHLFILSAKTPTALDRITLNLAEHLTQNPGLDISNVSYTLKVGRQPFRHRRMLVCRNRDEAIEALSSGNPRNLFTHPSPKTQPPIIFMFPGLGSQYTGMGLGLYRSVPFFRREMDRCFKILESLTGQKVKEILYPGNEERKQPQLTQPLIFSLQYALAKLLIHWGITPDAMTGYSFSEYTAACISGVLSLQDALKLVYTRIRLMCKLPGGAMVSVPLEAGQLAPLLAKETNQELCLAIDNGPSCVVSGPEAAVQSLEQQLRNEKLLSMRVNTPHAAHSPLMEPVADAFETEVRKVSFKEPQIPYTSNVTGQWITPGEVKDAVYWRRHLTSRVRFADGIRLLVQRPGALFIEIGPGRDLTLLVDRYLDKDSGQRAVDLVRTPQSDKPDYHFLLTRLGRLWIYGAVIDWETWHREEGKALGPHRIPLPAYPFEGQRYPSVSLNLETSVPLAPPQPEPAPTVVSVTPSAGPTPAPPADPANAALYSRPVIDTPYRPPETPTQQKLAALWQQFFKLSEVGIDDDFFDLGGDSLKAALLISMIHQQLKVSIQLPYLFAHPFIRQLADFIDGEGEEDLPYPSIPTTERAEYYPLSSQQERLFLLHQVEPGNTAYNTPEVMELEGHPETGKLQETFRALIRRQEILRTSFQMIDNHPRQRVHEQVEFEICRGVPPWSPLNGNHPGSHGGLPLQSFVRPFELTRAPLMRVEPITLGEDRHILLLDMHHIITDGMSFGIFIREFMDIYAGKELSPVTLAYRDFSQWQTHRKGSEALKRQETFWLDVFKGELPVLDLPADRPRPSLQQFEGDTIYFDIGAD